MTSEEAPSEEVLALHAENAQLRGQVTELVRVTTRMHRLRQALDERQRLYRSLAGLIGDAFATARSADAIANRAVQYIAYDLGYERAIIVSDLLDTVHHEGFWHDETLPLQAAAECPFGRDVRLALHTECQPTPDLAATAATLELCEAAYVGLFGSDGTFVGWLVCGCSPETADTSTRLTGRDADRIDIVRAVGSSMAVAMENRHTADKMRIAMERAQAASDAKSRFVANMTHELRTPLNAIIGYTELIGEVLDEEGLGNEFDADLQRVLLASRRLLRLVDDVLDLARVEAGTVQVDAEAFCVRELVDQIAAEVAPTAAASGNQIEIAVAPGSATMVSDPGRVRQVLVNLLTNAAKFTQHGEIALAVELLDLEIRFTVRDTGIGMSEDALSRVFRPFEQADNSTTRRFGGTGLGLHITQQLVGLLGGSIEATSAPGRGSTFYVTLPRNLPAPRNRTPRLAMSMRQE